MEPSASANGARPPPFRVDITSSHTDVSLNLQEPESRKSLTEKAKLCRLWRERVDFAVHRMADDAGLTQR